MKRLILLVACLMMMILKAVSQQQTCYHFTATPTVCSQAARASSRVPKAALLQLYPGLFKKRPSGVPVCYQESYGRVCRWPKPGQCKVNQDPCKSNPCRYGGTCIRQQSNFRCRCLPYTSGRSCETANNGNPCSSYPCQAGGTCTYVWSGHGFYQFRCACVLGRGGLMCERGQPGQGPIQPVARGASWPGQTCLNGDSDCSCETCYSTMTGASGGSWSIGGYPVVSSGEFQQFVPIGNCCRWSTPGFGSSGTCYNLTRNYPVLVSRTWDFLIGEWINLNDLLWVDASVQHHCICYNFT